MDNENPWTRLPMEAYEKHMGHGNVGQLEALSCILCDQLTLVAHIQRPVVAILGIAGGNGLCNIRNGQCKAVIGIDINDEYLNKCRERYGHLAELELHKIDLTAEQDRASNILKRSDLVAANLLVEHIYLDNFVYLVNKLERPVVSVTIQFNPDGRSFSCSGFESAFEDILRHGQDCYEDSLTAAMIDTGYELISREEYALPNKKMLIRLDYKRPGDL
jgi:hypothetical protein